MVWTGPEYGDPTVEDVALGTEGPDAVDRVGGGTSLVENEAAFMYSRAASSLCCWAVKAPDASTE